MPFLIAGFDQRELIHALNTRKSPTISLLTGIKKHSKSACGANRPDQTGKDTITLHLTFCGLVEV